MPRGHWLMKSEPDVYSIDRLAQDGTTFWDGVRNFEARNFMRDSMKPGDLAFFYHSNATPSCIAGIMRIARTDIPDETAFDPHDEHYDPKSDRATPTWYGVEVAYVETLPAPVSLHAIKAHPRLQEMALLRRSRLSVAPVTAAEWKTILTLAKAEARSLRAKK